MDFRALLMGLAFAVMWSSAFTSAHVVVNAAPPLGALALRFLISGGLAVGIALALEQSWRLTPRQWRATLVFGICQNALYLGLNFIAMQSVEASLAAIVASCMPLLVGLASWLWLGERLRPLGYAGLLIGVAGVALIMGARLQTGGDLIGVGLCVLGVISLSAATMAVRGAISGGNFLMVVGLQMLVGSAVLWPFHLAFEEIDIAWSGALVFSFAYITFVPGLAATFVWVHLVSRLGAVRAATFHFLNPFLGVAIASAFLGERMSAQDVAGVVIITAGILAVQVSRVKAA